MHRGLALFIRGTTTIEARRRGWTPLAACRRARKRPGRSCMVSFPWLGRHRIHCHRPSHGAALKTFCVRFCCRARRSLVIASCFLLSLRNPPSPHSPTPVSSPVISVSRIGRASVPPRLDPGFRKGESETDSTDTPSEIGHRKPQTRRSIRLPKANDLVWGRPVFPILLQLQGPCLPRGSRSAWATWPGRAGWPAAQGVQEDARGSHALGVLSWCSRPERQTHAGQDGTRRGSLGSVVCGEGGKPAWRGKEEGWPYLGRWASRVLLVFHTRRAAPDAATTCPCVREGQAGRGGEQYGRGKKRHGRREARPARTRRGRVVLLFVLLFVSVLLALFALFPALETR